MVAHARNPSAKEGKAGGSCEFQASLVYKNKTRTAKSTQKNPVSKIDKIK